MPTATTTAHITGQTSSRPARFGGNSSATRAMNLFEAIREGLCKRALLSAVPSPRTYAALSKLELRFVPNTTKSFRLRSSHQNPLKC